MLLLSETGDGWEAEAVFPLGRVTGRIFMVLYCRVVVSMNLPYRIVMVFRLGLVSNMTAPSLVVLSMNPSGSMRGAGMMSLVLSMEKGRLKACPVVAVGCLSFDRADCGPRRL